jgi:hypothetical protein
VTRQTDPIEQAIVDFFEGRGQFAALEGYVGMDASNGPELFANWVASLAESEQRAVGSKLAEIALGKRLNEYLPLAGRLMGELAVRGHVRAFQDVQPLLEGELESRVPAWLQAPDRNPPPGGLEFKEDWHYALQLWGVLHLLDSERGERAYRTLAEGATSPRFRQALILGRQAYAMLPSR